MINLAKGMPNVPCIRNSERVVTCTCARNPCTLSEEKTNARDGERKRKKRSEKRKERIGRRAFHVCRIDARSDNLMGMFSYQLSFDRI